jgi:hypothetical protein
MSRDADKYKYRTRADIDRRSKKMERREERFGMKGLRAKKTPKCEECGKFFENERALNIHYIKAHNKGYA